MAKSRVSIPVDSISGTVWGTDRTLGRDPGFSATMQKMPAQNRIDAKAVFTTKIISKSQMTRGGSKNRHTRAERYCFCDEAYQLSFPYKVFYLQSWWRAVTDDPNAQMSPYHIMMKICLKYMDEMAAFTHFSWIQRYRVINDSGEGWTNHQVILDQLHTFQADGWDCEAYKLLSIATKKNRITYDTLMIDYRLENDVTTRGETLVTIPFLQPESSMLIDVYSYYNPAND